MIWLWIPAVVLVTVFILVLCWLFFKDYTCCPCRRRSHEPVLPTHHTSSVPHDLYPPSAPLQQPVGPGGSPHLQLTHADLSVRDQESVLPTDCDANLFSISASLPPTHTPSKVSPPSSLFHSQEPQPSHAQELAPRFTSGLSPELVLRPEPLVTPRASIQRPSANKSSSSSFSSLSLSQDESHILELSAGFQKQEEKVPHKRTTEPEAQVPSNTSHTPAPGASSTPPEPKTTVVPRSIPKQPSISPSYPTADVSSSHQDGLAKFLSNTKHTPAPGASSTPPQPKTTVVPRSIPKQPSISPSYPTADVAGVSLSHQDVLAKVPSNTSHTPAPNASSTPPQPKTTIVPRSIPKQPSISPSYPKADVSLSPVHKPKKPPHAVSNPAARYYPRTARGTLHLHLKYANNLSLRKVIRFENGDIPTLDLHGMTVKETTKFARGFIEACMEENPRKFRIVTGRGLHSRNGVSRLKPRVIDILDSYDLEYREIYSGGCLQVSLD